MKRVNTDTLNPIEVYYRVEYSSKAEEIFDAFIKKNDDILTEMRNALQMQSSLFQMQNLLWAAGVFFPSQSRAMLKYQTVIDARKKIAAKILISTE